MKESQTQSNWTRLQRGQALVEYWATLPVAVAIMFSASLVVNFLNSSFQQTVNGLDRYCITQFTDMVAPIYQHSIESSAYAYDPDTNRTTVAYTVTSGTQPSISHWILGVPKSVADHVLQTSESWEWTNSDPTTGAMGMKFDIGYEPTGGSDTGNNSKGNNGVGNGEDAQPPGNPPVNDGAGTGPGNPGNKGGPGGKSSHKGRQGFVFSSVVASPALQSGATETRVITITLEGPYEFGTLSVTLKAGNTQVGSGTVSGPIAPKQQDSNHDSGADGSKGC